MCEKVGMGFSMASSHSGAEEIDATSCALEGKFCDRNVCVERNDLR